jgi:hypothetical protein
MFMELTEGGLTDRDREQSDLISLFNFFKIKNVGKKDRPENYCLL